MMNKSSIMRVVVLLLVLGFIIIEREWIRDAAYFLWILFYWLVSKIWRW